jgi:site-specific DNA-methyltransferase (adenine-specific)
MRLIIEASSDVNDAVWEPFGGLFSASLAAVLTDRKAYAAEIDEAYYSLGINRFENLSLFDG